MELLGRPVPHALPKTVGISAGSLTTNKVFPGMLTLRIGQGLELACADDNLSDR